MVLVLVPDRVRGRATDAVAVVVAGEPGKARGVVVKVGAAVRFTKTKAGR
ncbi:hypothetical protein L9W92_17760 [Pelotomaculum terephthalicicum JT]|nr:MULTISPECIES: hypothetical protein [Pelotomaculum]MCG9969847.1 hypothetical protein [Pelotomaculum terephthalicicum JT]